MADEANLEVARRLYRGFAERDPQGILGALAPDFRGVVAAGMPMGLGGTYEGPETTMREVWGPVFGVLDTGPVPDEYIAAEDGRIVVVGHYTGTARKTGRPHDAAFVHILRFGDGAIIELVQVTDTARWHEALAAQS